MDKNFQLSDNMQLSISKIDAASSSYGRVLKKGETLVFEFCMVVDDTLVRTNSQGFLLKIKVLKSFFDKYGKDLIFHSYKQKLTFNAQELLLKLSDTNPKSIADKILMEANSLLLIHQLLINSNSASFNLEQEASPLTEKKILEAEKYILQNISEKLTIQHIANIVGTNQGYLKTSFKILKGKTIHNFIKEQRMKLAKHLILTSSLSLSEVGLQVGYSSLSSFSQAFSNYYGIPPSSLAKPKP